MKYIILIALLICISSVIALPLETMSTDPSQIRVRIENLRTTPINSLVLLEDGDEPSEPVTIVSRTYAMPYRQATVQIESMLWNVFDQAGNLLHTEQDRNYNDVMLSSMIEFRELYGHTLRIQTQKQVGNTIRTLKDIEYSINYSDPISIPSSVSAGFVDAYKQLAANYETSYLRNLPFARPKMLIISHNSLSAYMVDFVNWKKSRGFDIYVESMQNIGTSVAQLKSFIVSHYDQYQCDYLLLMGDNTGNFAIPTNMHPSPDTAENNADDNHYAMITGNDYFPEMLVGRFSFGSLTEYLTIANKTIAYERNPYMTDTTWMRKGLFVAGNWAEGNLRPITPVQMSRSTRERMLDYGYAAIDTVFYPPTYPGTSTIQQSISQGAQIIMYRGWGDANGWHYPYFHSPDLDNTYNGSRMPIVYSIVCNTGDFANSVNPNFGEKWMRMGTPSTPGGCVAFVGPSDLHTKTRYNNSVSTGMMRYIYDYHGRTFGASVLAGKMELYNNFPPNQGPNDHVEFYFRVYNALSDPSMNMWILQPNTIAESVIEGGLSFAQSDSHIRINAPNLNGAIVTGSKVSGEYTYTKVEDGFAILPIDPEQDGDLILTITKQNFVPLVRTLTASEDASVGIVGNSLVGSIVNANTNSTLTLTFKNYSTAALSNLSITLSSPDGEMVQIANPTQSIAALAPGATADLSFNLSFGSGLHPRDILTFTAVISPENTEHSFQLKAGGAEFMVLSHSGSLPLGQNSNISFQITNIGTAALTDSQVEIYSLEGAASVSTPNVIIGSFGIGETKTISTSIQIQSDTYNGKNIPLKFTISDNQNYSIKSFYAVTAGNPSTTDPTGPCEYGYFAYDSFDTSYSEHPTYEWIPIDPVEGGEASVYLCVDDGSTVVDLPFTFRFYGQDYQQITICSNGWMSFGQTWMNDFYNYFIPATLGPKAMIAGYWDDLKGLKTGVNNDGSGIFNDMRICYWYDATNNRYIIEWNEAYNQYTIDLMQDASLEKFQIILYPKNNADGDIVIQYHTVDNPGIATLFSTVGIEDHTQTRGLTYTFANVYPPTATPLQAGLAIKFTTTAPDDYVSNSDNTLSIPFTMEQNYPNPFNPNTTISFNLMQATHANLSIYNLKGQLVKTLLNAQATAGKHSILWDGKDASGKSVSSGLYYYRLKTDSQISSRKMLLMK